MYNRDLETNILFRYYESQRAEVHMHIKEQMSIKFQMLIMTATATVVYTQIKNVDVLKIILLLLFIALGVVGYYLNETHMGALDRHIKRARKARENIKYIHSIAIDTSIGVSATEAKQYS